MAARVTAYIVVVIVAGTLIAGLIVGAQRDDSSGPVDLIVFNGNVYTADGRGRMAEAVAVRGNQILRVGSNREIKRLRRPQTRVIDAHGAAVVPGFIDTHVHLLDGGLGLTELSLNGASTLHDLERSIHEFAAANPEPAWIVGRGWSYALFAGGLPSRDVLDRIVPDRPAFLVADDGRTAWVNSKALALAGITRRTRSPQNGVILKDARTGEPTGVLKERAQRLMDKVLPPVNRDDRLRAIRSAIAEAHRYGITSVHTASSTPQELELFGEIRDVGDLKLRVYAALAVEPGFREADADRFDAIRKQYADDPLLKTGAVKLVLDGAVETHTAALLAPYVDKPTTGTTFFSASELTRLVSMLDRREWQILVHAAGDAAVRLALDALERAAASNPAPAGGRRHRIEHAELIDPGDLERLGPLGIAIVVKPALGPVHEVLVRNVGAERAAHAWSWSTLRARGARIILGSDWPGGLIDLQLGLEVAVRAVPSSPDTDAAPADGLTPAQAIDALTSDAAWASFDEQRKGSIAPGMLADLVILSTDVFGRPDLLPGARVEATIFGGEVVFDRSVEQSTTVEAK